LSALCRTLDAPAVDATLGEARPILATVIPELRRAGDGPAAKPPQQARIQLYRGVRALLRRAASARGALLVLEDLYGADESSLPLLEFIVGELRSIRAFVLVAFRDVEPQLSARVGEVIGRLTREGTSMSLRRLSQSEAEQLLRARAADIAADEIDALYRRTQGT
jgi:predicted ATPase